MPPGADAEAHSARARPAGLAGNEGTRHAFDKCELEFPLTNPQGSAQTQGKRESGPREAPLLPMETQGSLDCSQLVWVGAPWGMNVGVVRVQAG